MKYSTVRRHSGASIVEALVAMTITLSGMAAILKLHDNVISNGTHNRLTSAAVSAANAKLEELRTLPFDQLESNTDAYVFIAPSPSGSSENRLRRCWSIAPVSELGDHLLRAEVAVVRDQKSCMPGGDALANLTTLIARIDPRSAAPTFASTRILDGDTADRLRPNED